jgi:hypothetical protein
MAARAKRRDDDDLDLPPPAPTFDAYTGLLVISFIAMLAGIVFLWMDYSQYKGSAPKAKAPSVTTAAQ